MLFTDNTVYLLSSSMELLQLDFSGANYNCKSASYRQYGISLLTLELLQHDFGGTNYNNCVLVFYRQDGISLLTLEILQLDFGSAYYYLRIGLLQTIRISLLKLWSYCSSILAVLIAYRP